MTAVASAVDPQWQTWIAENLALGVSADTVRGSLREAGIADEAAAAEIAAAQAHPYFKASRSIAQSYGWVESLMDAYSDLWNTGGGATLERRAGLAPQEFFSRYYFGHRPVVLPGLADHWPARRWTLSSLRERFGDTPVEVMTGRDSDADHAWRYDEHRTAMSFGEYLAMVESGARTNDYYMVPRNENWQRDELRAMRADVKSPAGIVPSDITADEMTLLLGPAGTLTPLHHDNMNILLCQVLGRKHVRMVPSFERHRVYPRGGTFSQVDTDAPDLDRFPEYSYATVLETVLEPGDALFIPFGWWHWVHALDVSITVSFHRFAVPDGNTLIALPHAVAQA